MGCDGGTIPKRDELVRRKKKPEKKDKQAELNFRWGHCTITQQPLQKPIVACQLGRLYSKTSVLEALLDKTKMPEIAKHIKGMKDVKELNLTNNPVFKPSAKTSETYDESLIAPYICPIIGLEMSGHFRFVMIWSCGCVVSERALKAVNSQQCHVCQKAFTEDAVIVLNGGEEDLAAATVKMEARKARAKAEKKSIKKETTEDESTQNPQPSTSSKKPVEAPKRPASTVDISDPKFKKTKTDYSVAKDPNASEVYKSLFTTHKTAIHKEKAHWVTYNPFYN